MNEKAMIKGTTILSRLDFLRERGGEDAVKAVRKKLENSFDLKAGEIILSMSWFPLKMDDALCRLVAKELGKTGESIFREMGIYSAKHHSKMFMRILESRNTPDSFFAMIPRFHNTYDKNWGQMVYSKPEENSALLTVRSPGESYRSNCVSTIAYLEETCRLVTDTRVIAKEQACGALGNPDCEWFFTW